MPTVFAVRSAYMTGIWHKWPEEVRAACIECLASFQESDGYVRDPWLRESYPETLDRNERVIDNVRAETRQMLPLLIAIGAKPKYAVPLEHETPDQLSAYIHSQDWSNPWSAGSQWSHQAFMVAASKQAGKDVAALEAALLDCLRVYHHAENGAWYAPDAPAPPVNIQINGAMKICSGLAWFTSPPVMDFTSLARFCLHTARTDDSCSLMNQLFVLESLTRTNKNLVPAGPLEEVALRLLRESLRYYHFREGAFSFYPGRAQHSYYGVAASASGDCADLHGTAMQIWAVSLALKLLNLDEKCGWRLQKI
jgi:hypothetical protein